MSGCRRLAAVARTPGGLSWPPLEFSLPPARGAALCGLPAMTVRHKSGPYGYTQAKALVYSKYGEPADVLRFGLARPAVLPRNSRC